MASGSTRATLASGNFLGIMNCLMQLRKARGGAASSTFVKRAEGLCAAFLSFAGDSRMALPLPNKLRVEWLLIFRAILHGST